jgi:hypothetical protein
VVQASVVERTGSGTNCKRRGACLEKDRGCLRVRRGSNGTSGPRLPLDPLETAIEARWAARRCHWPAWACPSRPQHHQHRRTPPARPSAFVQGYKVAFEAWLGPARYEACASPLALTWPWPPPMCAARRALDAVFGSLMGSSMPETGAHVETPPQLSRSPPALQAGNHWPCRRMHNGAIAHWLRWSRAHLPVPGGACPSTLDSLRCRNRGGIHPFRFFLLESWPAHHV